MSYVPTIQDIEDLKLVLNINEDAEDMLLGYLLKTVGTKALNSMNRTDLPDGFQTTLIEMTADTYWLLQAARGDAEKSIASVSDKDQSVSYRDGSYEKVLLATAQALKSYDQQLDNFRKVGW